VPGGEISTIGSFCSEFSNCHFTIFGKPNVLVDWGGQISCSDLCGALLQRALLFLYSIVQCDVWVFFYLAFDDKVCATDNFNFLLAEIGVDKNNEEVVNTQCSETDHMVAFHYVLAAA
jgi:hypothetical protein